MIDNNANTLVSVVVITYNSAAFILDTLESIKSQSYNNIELVISDDCSTDNTVELCQKWIRDNGDLLSGVKLVSTPKNMGVSGNCNCGIKASNGKWIKLVAGDDQLTHDSVEEYLKYMMAEKKEICSSQLLLFSDDKVDLSAEQKAYDYFNDLIINTHQVQLRMIRTKLYIPSPAIFFSRKLFDEVGGFDERFPFCEEWPFFYKILEKGYHIGFLEKELVRYRIVDGSLSRNGNMINKRVFDDVKKYFYKVRVYKLLRRMMIDVVWQESLKYAYMEKRYLSGRKYSASILAIKFFIIFNPFRPFALLKYVLK